MKKISVHPIIGVAIVSVALLILIALLGLLAGEPVLRNSKFLVGIIIFIEVIIGVPEFTEKYDPKNNVNIKATILLISLVIFFLLIVFFLL